MSCLISLGSACTVEGAATGAIVAHFANQGTDPEDRVSVGKYTLIGADPAIAPGRGPVMCHRRFGASELPRPQAPNPETGATAWARLGRRVATVRTS